MAEKAMRETEVLREIPINSIEGVKIGHAQDTEAATGCTVILCPEGAVTGVDVRGGAPASREPVSYTHLRAHET